MLPGRPTTIQFDQTVPRFGVRVKRSGDKTLKTYVFQYKNKFGQQRRYTIDNVRDLTPEQARKKAEELRVQTRGGADPSADRKADRRALTVAQLCDDYLARPHSLRRGGGYVKASTLAGDRSRIERHIKPLLGNRAVASLTTLDMEELVRDLQHGKTALSSDDVNKGRVGGRVRGLPPRGGPAVAARVVGLLGTILQRAVKNKTIAVNPTRGVNRPADKTRRPTFSFPRVAALGVAMRQAEADGENVLGLRAIRILLLTGCRRMEVLSLQRLSVDHSAQCLHLPDTKTGAQTRVAGRSALSFLRSFMPVDGKPQDYILPG